MHQKRLRLLENLQAAEAYVAVVESGSITRAAARLGLTPSAVSKRVAELEGRARTTLLRRTTRRVSVTDIGHRFYEQCLHLLDEAERAEWELRDKARDPGGRIRMAAPVVFAQRQMASLLPDFLRLHPRIELELAASARTVNLVEEGFDLSIRLVRTEDLGRAGRVLAPNRRVFCAAASYLARNGHPHHPSDLADHDCLVALGAHRAESWRYVTKDGAKTVRVTGPFASDNVAVVAEAATQGLGIAIAGTFIVGDYLRSGRLVEVLPGYMVQDSVVAAVVPARGFVPYRVGLLIEFLAERFGSPPVWDNGLG
jgi:DNA-binding transcriptional LysR family regulator